MTDACSRLGGDFIIRRTKRSSGIFCVEILNRNTRKLPTFRRKLDVLLRLLLEKQNFNRYILQHHGYVLSGSQRRDWVLDVPAHAVESDLAWNEFHSERKKKKTIYIARGRPSRGIMGKHARKTVAEQCLIGYLFHYIYVTSIEWYMFADGARVRKQQDVEKTRRWCRDEHRGRGKMPPNRRARCSGGFNDVSGSQTLHPPGDVKPIIKDLVFGSRCRGKRETEGQAGNARRQ